MPTPRVLILRAPGTNCEEETAVAWSLAGAEPETWHIGRALEHPEALDRFRILTVPGGFSYGDDLGAGRIFATRLATRLGEAVRRFHDRGGLVLGICNGFQVLVKAGLLPGGTWKSPMTITFNDSGHYEDRWVRLAPTRGRCAFLDDDEPIELPVAHGEGKVLTADPSDIDKLGESGQVVLRYVDVRDQPTQSYPSNPNGSQGAVAGLCDPSGRIFGLMPHPERNVDPLHHPQWTRRGPKAEGDGLRIFRNAVRALGE
jgi:phosphoribosylformylglycinamidine synthase subunit PurQ / glutaminase